MSDSRFACRSSSMVAPCPTGEPPNDVAARRPPRSSFAPLGLARAESPRPRSLEPPSSIRRTTGSSAGGTTPQIRESRRGPYTRRCDRSRSYCRRRCCTNRGRRSCRAFPPPQRQLKAVEPVPFSLPPPDSRPDLYSVIPSARLPVEPTRDCPPMGSNERTSGCSG